MIELTEGRRRALRRTGFVAVPALIATMAVLHPGAAVSQVDLNDGAVWLTNGLELKIGRYNPTVEELNAGLVTTSPTFDVLQDGMDVLLVEPNRIAVVDPASVVLGAMADIPYDSDVSMAGGTTAVTRPKDGAVFAAPTQAIGGLQVGTGEPAIELGEGGVAVVAASGLVLAVEPDGAVHHLDVGGDAATESSAGTLSGSLGGPIEQVTAVGDDVVVLAAGRLHTTAGDVDLSGYGGRLALQQPGPAADSVLVASTTALLKVPLDGGSPEELTSGASGTPARPVLVAGCAHAAWSSPVNGYLMSCSGQEPYVEDLTGIASSDTLAFRVNRDVVVLNDVLAGRVWLPMEDAEVREPNWEDVLESSDDDSDSDAEIQDVVAAPQVECTGTPTAPSAEDDEYGVRPGGTLLLPVVANDAASGCGVLVISEFEPVDEAFGTVQLVHGGRALQLQADPAATGTAEFTYTVTDGHGDTAPATGTVTVTAQPAGTNHPPEQPRVGAMVLELGGAATYDVLTDFVDPDGDQLVVLSAVAQKGGTARARGDGRVRFQSDNTTLGRQTILVTVSDGTETFTGELFADVRATGSLAPVVEGVHAVTYVDEPVTVHPLDSVRTESREPARLAGVEEVVGLTVTADVAGGSFTVSSPTPGSFYVPFTVAAAPQQTATMARIDVLERPAPPPPPVPVLDVALLPPGGEATVDPLANDTDASGGVLVLQSVDVPPDSGVRAAILDHRLVRFSTTRTLEQAIDVTYRVANGAGTAVGTVRVQPVPAAADQQAPVVPDVEATVRTGGVVTIPVLENAFDPDGDELTLTRDLPDAPTGAQGLMFVSGDVLRYRAPDVPTEVAVTFTVSDPMGNKSSGIVTVTVHASDPETKAPAHPEPLTARVYSGESVDIPVPLTGIDVDGDGVLLLGPDQTPTKGIVTVGAADELVYEAFPGETGTDTFTYAVEDWTGRRAVATVRVGIAERPATPAEVITRDDEVAIRPGQAVDVLVLGNDTDTGGGELTLDPTLQMDPGVDAVVEGQRITVRTTEPGLLQILYTARNERGGQGTGMLTVTVAEDAPILAPVAKDVVVPAKDTLNAASVEVDVKAVAQNPSGPMSDLEVLVDPSAAPVAAVNPDETVTVQLVDHAQTLPFILRNANPDAEGISSYAFIVVPALGDFPPLLRPDAEELSVLSGEPLEIDLEELVQVAPGREAIVDDWSTVQAAKSDGSSLVVDDGTLRFTSEEGYAGPASISALVSDGPLDEPTTHSRTLTFPIAVLAAEQVPPVFTPSVLEVAPGDTARVDLAVFTSAPVETVDGAGQFTYALGDTPAGFTVDLSGTQLSVTPGDTVPRGTVAGIPLTIDYGGDEPVPAQVDVRVVASSRPLARVLTHEVPDGVEGQPVTVSVLDGAYNPFDAPLVVLEAAVETPDSGRAEVSGAQVTVRPDPGFIGQMVTRYSVRDATGDLDRVVEGRIVVTVRGAPEAPTAPAVEEVGDGTVKLRWEAPVNNGAPIDRYRLTAVAGGTSVTECTSALVCTVEGLKNNVTYRFTVAAHNAVGWSEESPASGDARPDVLPGAPAAPTVKRSANTLDVAWDAPENRGSPITAYDVEISPAAPTGLATFQTSAREMEIPGLVNGQVYQVKVCARNDAAPECGPWSPTTPGKPAQRPGPPRDVDASLGEFSEQQRSIEVTWRAPESDGGEPVERYIVRVSGREPAVVDTTPGTTDYSYSFPAEWRTYTITVEAVNAVGTSDQATRNGEVWRRPNAVQDVTATPTSGAWAGGSVKVAWAAPQPVDGAEVVGYVVRYAGRDYDTSDLAMTFSDLPAGRHDFTVTAYSVHGPQGRRERALSDPVPADATVTTAPQGLVGPPVPTVGTGGAVTLEWTGNRGGDGGSAILDYTVTLREQGGGAPVTSVITVPSITTTLTPGHHRLEITVAVRNELGTSPARTYTVEVDVPPPANQTVPSGTIRHPSTRRAL